MTANNLSNKLKFLQDELERCSDIAMRALFSQASTANVMALGLLENSLENCAVDTLQNSFAKKASHKVKALKDSAKQLTAELVQEQIPQETPRDALYAYAAHQKRAERHRSQAPDVASGKSVKLS